MKTYSKNVCYLKSENKLSQYHISEEINNELVQQNVFLWLEEAFMIVSAIEEVIASCIVSVKYRGNNLVSDVSKNRGVGGCG